LAINQDSTFSGILLYHHFFNINGCNEIMELIINPRAEHPLSDSFLKDFERGGIEISELPEL